MPTKCTAITKNKTPCRQWAVRGSNPPRCIRHTDHPPPRLEHNRRCTAVNKDGTQCRRSAMLDTEPPICPIHNGRTHASPLADHQRCTAVTRQGGRCRNRARLDSADSYGRALCAAHLPDRTWLPPDHRRCTAVDPNGVQCRQWVLTIAPDDHSPGRALCVFHAGLTLMDPFPAGESHPNWIWGHYSQPTLLERDVKFLFPVIRAAIQAAPDAENPIPILQENLLLCRLLVGHLAGETRGPDVPTWKFLRYTGLMFRGVEIIRQIVLQIHKQKQLRAKRLYGISYLPKTFMEPIQEVLLDLQATDTNHDESQTN